MKNELCPWYKDCKNGDSGCYSVEPKNCVRFLPLNGTNLIKITGVVETPPDIDCNKFNQYFINWLDAMGWNFCGGCSPYDNEE